MMKIRSLEKDDWEMIKKILHSYFPKKQANGKFKGLKKLNKLKPDAISVSSLDLNIVGFSIKENGKIVTYLEQSCWKLEIPKN